MPRYRPEGDPDSGALAASLLIFSDREIHGKHELLQNFTAGIPAKETGSNRYIVSSSGLSFTLTFQVPNEDLPEMERARYPKRKLQDGQSIAVSHINVKIDRQSFRNALFAHQTIENIFERVRGYPPGTISRVSELAIAHVRLQ